MQRLGRDCAAGRWRYVRDVDTDAVVMPGLDPGIHDFLAFAAKTWMAGSSPAMTAKVVASSLPSLAITALFALRENNKLR